MDDVEFAKFIIETICRHVGGDVKQFQKDWNAMPLEDKKPFMEAAIEIRIKTLDLNTKSN